MPDSDDNQNLLDLENVVPTQEPEQTTAPTPEPTPNAEGGSEPTPPVEPNPQPTEPASVPTPAPSTPVYVDAKQLAAELTAQQQAAQPVPQMSQEEIDRILRTVRLNDADVETFFNVDTPLAQKTQLLQSMLVSAVENAVARNQVIMQDTIGKFYQQEFMPIAQKISIDEARASRNEFYKEYPGLEEYQDAVSLVARAAMQDPAYSRLSSKEASAKVAESVTSLLRKSLPNFDPKVKAVGQTPQTTSVPKATMPSFQTGTKVTTTPASGQYPSSNPADSDIFGDEGLN